LGVYRLTSNPWPGKSPDFSAEGASYASYASYAS
jgi:hypothetical protein